MFLSNANARIISSSFQENRAFQYGGAIFAGGSSDATVPGGFAIHVYGNTTFAANEAGMSGSDEFDLRSGGGTIATGLYGAGGNLSFVSTVELPFYCDNVACELPGNQNTEDHPGEEEALQTTFVYSADLLLG